MDLGLEAAVLCGDNGAGGVRGFSGTPRDRAPRPQGPPPRSPSGLYWAMMVTVWPAFFSATAACSCVALRRSTPFTCGTGTHHHREGDGDGGVRVTVGLMMGTHHLKGDEGDGDTSPQLEGWGQLWGWHWGHVPTGTFHHGDGDGDRDMSPQGGRQGQLQG